MEPEYDEQGNIPGPGQSRVGTIPRYQSEDDQAVLEHENRWGKEIEDISKDVIVTAASQGKFGSTPASKQTVDVAATEVLEMHPTVYKRAVAYHRHNPDAGWGAAIRAAKLTAGKGPYDPKVYIPPNERIGTQKGDPLQSVNPEFEQGYVAPGYKDIYKVQTRLINQNLTGPGKKFNWNAYRNGLRQNKKSGRTIATLYSTTPHSKIANWETHRQGLVGAYTSLYGKAMDKYGYTPSDIDVDHIFTLQQLSLIHISEPTRPY